MKIAVIGGGVLGMEMARSLHEMEAAVTLFTKSGTLGGKLARMATFNPDYLLGSVKVSEYFKEKIEPLAQELPKNIPIKEVEVLRVNKRFLHPEEEVEGRTRLADLFRVVYRVDPTAMIESQKKENPEVYKSFDPEMLKSLGENMEAFEDFDLVVDARGVMENPNHLGPGGVPALNELGLMHHNNLYYGWESSEALNDLPSGHIVIAGCDEEAALGVLKLRNWLEQKNNSLTVICEKSFPFGNLSEGLRLELDKFIAGEEVAFTKRMEEFREKVFAWRELEEYEKAKIPMPTEPKPPFDVLVDSYITSLDRLLDAEGWFLTIESPAFKGRETLSTVKADSIFVLKGFKHETALSADLQTNYNFRRVNSLDDSGLHPEPGFYTLTATDLEDGIKQIQPIIDNMLSFFSKVQD